MTSIKQGALDLEHVCLALLPQHGLEEEEHVEEHVDEHAEGQQYLLSWLSTPFEHIWSESVSSAELSSTVTMLTTASAEDSSVDALLSFV